MVERQKPPEFQPEGFIQDIRGQAETFTRSTLLYSERASLLSLDSPDHYSPASSAPSLLEPEFVAGATDLTRMFQVGRTVSAAENDRFELPRFPRAAFYAMGRSSEKGREGEESVVVIGTDHDVTVVEGESVRIVSFPFEVETNGSLVEFIGRGERVDVYGDESTVGFIVDSIECAPSWTFLGWFESLKRFPHGPPINAKTIHICRAVAEDIRFLFVVALLADAPTITPIILRLLGHHKHQFIPLLVFYLLHFKSSAPISRKLAFVKSILSHAIQSNNRGLAVFTASVIFEEAQICCRGHEEEIIEEVLEEVGGLDVEYRGGAGGGDFVVEEGAGAEVVERVFEFVGERGEEAVGMARRIPLLNLMSQYRIEHGRHVAITQDPPPPPKRLEEVSEDYSYSEEESPL